MRVSMITPQIAGNVSLDRISVVLGIFLRRDSGGSGMAAIEVHTFPFFESYYSCLCIQGARLDTTVQLQTAAEMSARTDCRSARIRCR